MHDKIIHRVVVQVILWEKMQGICIF